MTAPAAPDDGAVRLLAATRGLMWLLVVPVAALLGVLTWRQHVQETAQAEAALVAQAQARALELEAAARPAMAHVQDLRRLMEARWADPPPPGALMAALAARRDGRGQADGWTLDRADASARERWGQVWWADPTGTPPAADWMGRARLFVEVARLGHQRGAGFEATWFAAADANTSFGYPWIDTERMLRSMGQATLRAVDGPRQAAVERSRRALAEDPNDLTFWGPPYVSQLDGQLVVSHGAVVMTDGQYRGEVSVDVRLAGLQDQAQRWASSGVLPQGSRVWIVDPRLQVLADSAEPLQGPAGDGRADERVRRPLVERLPAGVARAHLDDLLLTPGQVRRGGGWRLMAAHQIGAPWFIVHAVPDATVRAAVLPTLGTPLWIALALGGTFLAGQALLARRFVGPALSVLSHLRALSTRDDDEPPRAPNVTGRWKAWVDQVDATFRRQRELQRQQRREEAFKSALIDHSASGILTTDDRGCIVAANPAAERLLGWREDDMRGRIFGDLLVAERVRGRHFDHVRRLQAGDPAPGLNEPTEIVLQHRDGHGFPAEMLVARVHVDGQDFYLAHLQDLSARKAAEGQIAAQREALRRAERMGVMGSLLAGVAHELNNPLAVVLGRAHLLEEKLSADPALGADARRIREAAERCGRIVRTFLDLARSRPARPAEVRLGDLARAACDMLAGPLKAQGIELVVPSHDARLPAVWADADQVGQVLLAMLVQAQQSARAGGPPHRVEVATGAGAGQVWIDVSSSGPARDAATLERLFEPLFSPDPEAAAAGPGLAVARTIAQAHGGTLAWLQHDAAAARHDAPVLRLSLPAWEVEAAPAARAEEEADPSAPSARDAGPARVLVVDDEPDIAALMRDVLEGDGHEVLTAESGEVALALLKEVRFDAIVSDLRMPQRDGASLWQEVNRSSPELARRTLFVTGDTLSADARGFLDQTGCPSLDKPFRAQELVRAVRALLQGPAGGRAATTTNETRAPGEMATLKSG